MKYDYLIVGSGLYGSTFARLAKDAGKSVIVVEKRNHIGGNVYTENTEGINVHKYGAHIFHTDNKEVWEFVNRFAKFNDYKHQVIADYKGERYNLPFNMNTFKQMWNINTPEEAKKIIEEQSKDIKEINNLEDQCISMVGTDIYNKLVKGYTEKQWGRECKDLPSSIIKRLPLRFKFNNNYFNDQYQGIPIGGYTKLVENMLEGIEVKLNYDYLKHKGEIEFDKLVYTGPIDEYYDYCFGRLEYRTLRFEEETINKEEYQGTSVINYTDKETPFTRIIEHKHFDNSISKNTIITKEYPSEWKLGDEPYYPVNDDKNNVLYNEYLDKSKNDNVIFGGRLAEYNYYYLKLREKDVEKTGFVPFTNEETEALLEKMLEENADRPSSYSA